MCVGPEGAHGERQLTDISLGFILLHRKLFLGLLVDFYDWF